MATVPAAIMVIVIVRTRLRPIRSASGPKKNPPIGRTRNDTANAPKVATSANPEPLPPSYPPGCPPPNAANRPNCASPATRLHCW